jgi:hypothetical protein
MKRLTELLKKEAVNARKAAQVRRHIKENCSKLNGYAPAGGFLFRISYLNILIFLPETYYFSALAQVTVTSLIPTLFTRSISSPSLDHVYLP